MPSRSEVPLSARTEAYWHAAHVLRNGDAADPLSDAALATLSALAHRDPSPRLRCAAGRVLQARINRQRMAASPGERSPWPRSLSDHGQ